MARFKLALCCLVLLFILGPISAVAATFGANDFGKAAGILVSARILEADKINAGANLTRTEAAVICTVLLEERRFKAEEYAKETQTAFCDVDKDNPAFAYIAYSTKNGLVPNVRDGQFKPDSYITFGDLCLALLNVLGVAPEQNPVATARKLGLFNGVSDLPHANGYVKQTTALPIIVNAMYTHSPRIQHRSDCTPATIAAVNFYAAQRPNLFDVIYIPTSADPKHRLDVYYPAGESPQSGWPVIISIHGGGFSRGDKFGNKLNTFAFEALEHGYAVVSISYRLTQTALVPAQILDTKAAVRFLRKHAAQLELNAHKFVLMGYSSGANLAALAATSPNHPAFEDGLRALNAVNASDKVAAAVAFYGHYDQLTQHPQYAWLTGANNPEYDAQYAGYLQQRGAFNAAYDLPYAYDPDWVSSHYGKPLEQAKDLVALMNPATFAATANTPLLLPHGEMDSTVNFLQSVDLARALKATNAPVDLVLAPGAEHGADFHAVYGMDKVFAWIDEVLRP